MPPTKGHRKSDGEVLCRICGEPITHFNTPSGSRAGRIDCGKCYLEKKRIERMNEKRL